MAKLSFYVIRKDGKRGVLGYEEVYLCLPKELHELVELPTEPAA